MDTFLNSLCGIDAILCKLMTLPNHHLSLQPKIPPHKQNINHTKKNNHPYRIQIPGLRHNKPCNNQSLNHALNTRNHQMRNFQLIGHNLVHVFPMRLQNILFKHYPVNNGQNSIHPIQTKQNNPTDILRFQN